MMDSKLLLFTLNVHPAKYLLKRLASHYYQSSLNRRSSIEVDSRDAAQTDQKAARDQICALEGLTSPCIETPGAP